MPSDMLRTSCLTREEALDFLAGRLPADREIEIDDHVQQCPECSDRIDRLSDDSDLRDALRAHQHYPGMPHLEDSLAEFRKDLYAMDNQAAPEMSGLPKEMSGLPKTVISDVVSPADSQRNSAGFKYPRKLRRFRILRRLGKGGFGVVYLADDTLLHRQVALKLPRLAPLDDPQQRTRFLREGRATAGLYHPHILPMYEAGEVDGLCYLTSMYCSGPTLAAWLRERKEPVTPEMAAYIVVLLADALEHAHQRGVLHRDVKPSNVLLDTTRPCGPLPFTPLLADFGLAKLVDADLTATASNVLLGTPRYMAPEQALGRNRDVGPATDVYSLGTVLYELVTGAMPIAGGDNADTLRRLLTDLPIAPRHKVSDIPRDLDAICLKCLEKSPEHRYATAAELAADLRRFLDGIPTLARPMPIPAHAWRWTKRHPGPASVLLTLVVATAVIWILILVNIHRIDTANTNLQQANVLAHRSQQQAEQNAAQAEQSARRTQQFLYAADVALADRACRQGDVQQMLALLNRHRPVPGEPDIRGFEWHLLYRSAQMQQRTLLRCSGDVYKVCFGGDGRLFAAADKDGQVRICDGRTFQIRRVLKTGQGEVNGVAFSPDGAELATAGEDGTVRLWSAETGRARLTIDAIQDYQAYCAVFTPDGQRLITCGEEAVIHVWDRKTGRAAGVFKGHTNDVESLALSPDGRLLASASRDGSVRLWDLDSKQESAVVASRRSRLSGVAFSPDGKWIADASLDGLATIRSVSSRESLVDPLQHFDGVDSVAFSADGSLLATGDRTGAVRIWRIADHLISSVGGPARRHNAPLRSWTAHGGQIWSLAFSPDSGELITGGGDGLVKAWSLSSLATDNHLPTPPRESLYDFAVMPSGKLLTAGSAGVVTWNLSTRQRNGNFAQSNEDDWLVVASRRDGRWVAAGTRAGVIRLWDTRTRAPIAQWKSATKAQILNLHLTSDGKMLAARTDDNWWLFELPSLRLLTRFPDGRVVAFSPDNHYLAIENRADFGTLDIWDVARQQRIRHLAAHREAIRALAYSPDGRLLASGGDDRLIKLWPVNWKAPPTVLTGHRGRLISATFSPDGRSLISIDENRATGHRVSTLKVWNVATGEELLSRTDSKCRRAALSPDGCSLVIQEFGDRIRVIDVSPLTPRTNRH